MSNNKVSYVYIHASYEFAKVFWISTRLAHFYADNLIKFYLHSYEGKFIYVSPLTLELKVPLI